HKKTTYHVISALPDQPAPKMPQPKNACPTKTDQFSVTYRLRMPGLCPNRPAYGREEVIKAQKARTQQEKEEMPRDTLSCPPPRSNHADPEETFFEL
ncbi:hypothetical protein MOQ26_23050, partial [Stenotrophomonas maltophilia]|nr:hypothetical protein [Stenotrophomonas maltophilia]